MSRGACRGAALAALCLLLLVATGTLAAQPAGPPASSMVDRYRAALRVDPDNLPLHYFLGIALLYDGDNQGAIDEFRRAYPAFTDSVEMQYNLGLAYSRLGDLDSAQLYFDQAESLGALTQPDVYPLANAYYNLALAYQEKEDYAEAERLFARVLQIAPDRFEIHRLLGDCLARGGDIDGALAEFDRYLQHYPGDATARDYVYALHFNRGLKQLEAKNLEAARASFGKALEASPDSPVALYYLGVIAYRQGKTEATAKILGEIYAKAPTELRSSTRSMLYNSALTLLERQQLETAHQAAAALLSAPDAATKDFYLAGNIDLARKDFAAATRDYKQVLKLDPRHRGAAVNLVAAQNGAIDAFFEAGRQRFAAHDFQGALEQFRQALALDAQDARALSYSDMARKELAKQAEVLFAQGRTALAQGQPRQALTAARSGLALTPAAPTGLDLQRQALARLQQEIDHSLAEAGRLATADDLAGAAAAYRRTLALAPDNTRARSALDGLAARLREQTLDFIGRGDKAIDEGNIDAARKAFAEARSLDPDLAEVKAAEKRLAQLVSSMAAEELLWGRRARSAGRLQEAREHFGNALALKDSPAVRNELAEVEGALADRAANLLTAARKEAAARHFKQARGLYGRLLALVPDHAAGRRELATLGTRIEEYLEGELVAARKALAGNNFDGALAGFRRVLDVDPGNKEALAGLESGRKQLAGRLAKLVREGNRDLGDGRFQAAEATFRQVLTIDPYQSDARSALDRINQLRLSGVNPGDEQKLYLQGIDFYTRGKYQEAMDAWQKVLALDPGHEKARMNIEKAQRKLQHIQEYRGG